MWRYHKHLKVWLTKDNGYEPVRVSATEERGFYIFFDTNSWQRQRVSVSRPSHKFLKRTLTKTHHQRELVLRYDDLEDRIVPITGSQTS